MRGTLSHTYDKQEFFREKPAYYHLSQNFNRSGRMGYELWMQQLFLENKRWPPPFRPDI